MVPLGDLWGGECRLPDSLPATPGSAVLPDTCNLGYARGRCPRFPDGPGPDAVRFAVASHTAETVSLRFSIERGHLPFAHGPLVFSITGRCLTAPPPGNLLRRQAEAYLESYLRRKNLA